MVKGASQKVKDKRHKSDISLNFISTSLGGIDRANFNIHTGRESTANRVDIYPDVLYTISEPHDFSVGARRTPHIGASIVSE